MDFSILMTELPQIVSPNTFNLMLVVASVYTCPILLQLAFLTMKFGDKSGDEVYGPHWMERYQISDNYLSNTIE